MTTHHLTQADAEARISLPSARPDCPYTDRLAAIGELIRDYDRAQVTQGVQA